MNTTPTLPQLDRTTLTTVARAALQRPAAVLTEWQPPAPLTDTAAVTNPSSGGVYRVRGSALDDSRPHSWSVILKALHSPAGVVTPDGSIISREFAEDGSAFNYWRREALAYQSGLLDDLPGGLSAPACFAVAEHADERVWLWLEDLGTEEQPDWSLGRYALAARQLGAFNATYLTRRPLPDAVWLSREY